MAEHTRYLDSVCAVWRTLTDKAGGVVTAPEMDRHRLKFSSLWMFGTIPLAAGLGPHVSRWFRAVGVHEWPSDCLSRCVPMVLEPPLTRSKLSAALQS